MDFNQQKAIFLQIADLIFEKILLGSLKPQERILSVREMAIQMEVNPNTVMRTFSYLQDNDIIYNKRGLGYFISDEAEKKTLKLKKEAFLRDELPHILKSMQLLGISVDELHDYQKNNNHEN
jgi:GntR family transcriptional regulator